MRRLPDRAWVPAAGALLLAVAFATALLVRAEGDASLLVHAGPPWTDAEAARGSLTVQDADEAFDGQFFYRLGVDPMSDAEQVAGVTFDIPEVRWGRWGYGAAAFVASGGDPDVVPEALLALNVVAAAVLGAVGGGLARAHGRHAAWGLLFGLWPGFAYSLSLDTSELFATCLALGSLLAAHHRRWPACGTLVAAAVLTRESTVVFAGGLLVAGAARWYGSRRRWVGPLAAGGVGVAVLLAWQLLARQRFGELPATSAGALNLGAPFADLVGALGDALPPGGGDEAFRLLSFAALFGLVGAAGWCWWQLRHRVADDVRGAEDAGSLLPAWVAWVPAVALLPLLSDFVLAGATSFMRTTAEAATTSTLLLLARAPRRLLALVSVGAGGMWLLTAASQVAKLG